MYCILYWITFANLQYVQKQRICRENSKVFAWRKFCGHFCSRRKAANPLYAYTYVIRFLAQLGRRIRGSAWGPRGPKNQRKGKNLLTLYYGIFQPSVVSRQLFGSLACQTCTDKKSSFTKIKRTLPGERLERRSRRRRPRRRSTPTTSRRDRVSDRSSASWPSSSSSSISLASHGRWSVLEYKI